MMSERNMQFLYTDIGRGHPYYLDGLYAELASLDSVQRATVFECSRGVSRLAWQAAKKTYQWGSSQGGRRSLYSRLRAGTDYNKNGVMQQILGRDVRKVYMGTASLLVVGHPLLVGIFRGRDRLVYQHGEVVVPSESLVRGGYDVLLPWQPAADAWLQAGFSSGQVHVTGLFVEVWWQASAADWYQQRMARMDSDEPLTGGFFSSGAEPRPHVERMLAAIQSSLQGGMRVRVAAKENGHLHAGLQKYLKINSVSACCWRSGQHFDIGGQQLIVGVFNGREELDVFSRAIADQLDFFVAPSHERTHWALGLGLPQFILDPAIGTFAPLNRAILIEQGVGYALRSLDEAAGFSALVGRLCNEGKLQRMAEAGWGRYPIDGFQSGAAILRELSDNVREE